MREILERLFPGLQGGDFQITSERDPTYNCIAWSVGVNDAWWWPGDPGRTFWHDDLPRELTLTVFRQLYQRLGYSECLGEAFESGLEKIALFCNPMGEPTHAARQLSNGRWTSKLGHGEDIVHNLRALEGEVYGLVVLVMSRLQDFVPLRGEVKKSERS